MTQSYDYAASYNVTSPILTGYTADKLTVSGTMPAENVTVDVTYTINNYTLTINYKYADGSEAAETYSQSYDFAAAYSIVSPTINGYTADILTVSGTMPANDLTVDVTYSINSYTLTINYKYTNGETAAEQFVHL